MKNFFENFETRRETGSSEYNILKSIVIDDIVINFTIDEINKTSETYKAYYHRIGKSKKNSSQDSRMDLYNLALGVEDYQSIEVLLHSLSDDLITSFTIPQENHDKILVRLKKKINPILESTFPPSVTPRCSNCPFLFICPT